MTAIGFVMDAAAVLAYGSNLTVGRLIAGAEAGQDAILVPVLCLADGYRRTEPEEGIHLLDALSDQPAVKVTPVDADDGPILGGWAGVLGSYSLAHAVLEAATHHVPIITGDRRSVLRILPEQWPVIEI